MGAKNFGVGIAVKNNVEAVEFYKKVFGLELGFSAMFPEDHEYHGQYQHAELEKDGKGLFAVTSLTHDFDSQKQIISFGMYFDTEAELREAFNLLSDGGIVKEPIGAVPWSPCCATVTDKFGITWWISIYSAEDKINDVLKGNSLNNALNFAAFLSENGIPLTSNGDGEGWAVGGIVGDSIGFMLINGAEQTPGPWTIWFNSCDFGGGESFDSELKETAWSHASNCGHCHAGWKNCGGGERTIFGRKFDWLCHSPLMFTDPDSETLENVKKLIMILRQKNA
jgi:PhnB protein